MKPLPTYFGGKDASGAAEQLDALCPAHSVYVECFLGNGALLRRKRPALHSIGIERDARVCAAWRRVEWPGLELVEGDALEWLRREGPQLPSDALVYADPPYPWGTRKSSARYRHDMTDDDHARLLDLLDALPCSVLVSTYPNAEYASRLSAWECHSFTAGTRSGRAVELVYRRSSLATYGGSRTAGRNFRERERIKRKAGRWVARILAMPAAERDYVLSAVLAARVDGAR